MFEVLNDFIEKEHKDLLYKAGETYPKAGFKADPKRVGYLQSNENIYNKAFLGPELEKEKNKAPKEPVKDETSSEDLSPAADENEDKEDKEKPKRTTKKETNK